MPSRLKWEDTAGLVQHTTQDSILLYTSVATLQVDIPVQSESRVALEGWHGSDTAHQLGLLLSTLSQNIT